MVLAADLSEPEIGIRELPGDENAPLPIMPGGVEADWGEQCGQFSAC